LLNDVRLAEIIAGTFFLRLFNDSREVVLTNCL